ncbi:MAG: HpcH/HpaI aldolase/citrate lyase family protein [Clostridia bacterium]|nr:HpcH/HpaI aldolase/citrate lyase family protein [Clostridia bacterium]
MLYFGTKDRVLFFQEPSCFNKHTEKDVLKYAIGANMYIPATKHHIFEKLINNEFHEVGAITFCCEDAIPLAAVSEAEQNILGILKNLDKRYKKDKNLLNQLPLIFIRVRNVDQFRSFSSRLNKNTLRFLAGFNFPKFTSRNGREYFEILKNLSEKHNEVLYGMPILESEEIVEKETRLNELHSIQEILNEYSDYLLNIRVGGTDFSSIFGLRRSVDKTIYDIKVISDCLMDILNFFLRKSQGYVISGPVWEYFSYNEDSKEIIGLKRELDMDIQNGFQGKTIIHPSQINVVNERYIVPYHDFVDATNILEKTGGVFKSSEGNRMNEVAPHTNWALKIVARAKIFGVLERDATI